MRFESENVVECLTCTLLFREHLPPPSVTESVYDAAYSGHARESSNRTDLGGPDEKSVPNMETPPEIHAQLLFSLGKFYGPLEGRAVLDFGAGVGGFCRLAREAGMSPVAVEPNDLARQVVAQQGIPAYANLQCLLQSSTKGTYDFIVLIEVLEHLPAPWDELRCLATLLAPDGKMFITTPNANGLHARIAREKWRDIRNPTHLYWFTYRSLMQLCDYAALKQVERVRWPLFHQINLPQS